MLGSVPVLLQGTEEYDILSFGISRVPAEFQTENLSNTGQNWYRLE